MGGPIAAVWLLMHGQDHCMNSLGIGKILSKGASRDVGHVKSLPHVHVAAAGGRLALQSHSHAKPGRSGMALLMWLCEHQPATDTCSLKAVQCCWSQSFHSYSSIWQQRT